MLIIILFSSFSDMLCMTQWAGSTWKNITESPYTPYALSPVAGAAGWVAGGLTWKAGFCALDRFNKQLHPKLQTPLTIGVIAASMTASALPSLTLTEMIRKQREPYLFSSNFSSLQFYYPAIIQGLSLGLPFAYYLAKKDSALSSYTAATILSCMAAYPAILAGKWSEDQESKRKKQLEQQHREEERERHRHEERVRQQEMQRQLKEELRKLREQHESAFEAAPAA